MFSRILIIFLFLINIHAVLSADFHHDAVNYETYQTCLQNGTPLPVSENFSFGDIEGESPEVALLDLNQFVIEQHRSLHDALYEALNDKNDEEHEGLIQAMLLLGIGITYKDSDLTTRHHPLDQEEIVYTTKKPQLMLRSAQPNEHAH